MWKLFGLSVAFAAAATVAMAQPSTIQSRITSIEVRSSKREGDFERLIGTVRGIVDPRDPVVGLAELPKNASGFYEYASDFEIIQRVRAGPVIVTTQNAGPPGTHALYIDAENRGSPISQSALGAFLRSRDVSYARVQWQAGISAGVPDRAQGIGLVIIRDFARMFGRGPHLQQKCEQDLLANYDGISPWPPGCVVPKYQQVMLGGISQSAWFVNTFIAEGFNVDPVRGDGVFDAAVAVDGVGYWLPINQLGAKAGAAQTPYIIPHGLTLQRTELLTRPATDPLYVDIANYSDFYRLRAGLTSVNFTGPKFRRYDFPSPHAVGTAQSGARCNGGQPVTFHTLRYAPYLRAIVLGMLKEIGVASAKDAMALPPSKVFTLGASPPASPNFNGLPGVAVRVPVVENGWPKGGVEFPESALRIGDIDPPAVAPAVTTSIAETCGNFSGFKPYSRAFLDRLYGGRDGWLESYSEQVDRLIREGFLLAEDKAGMLEAAGKSWPVQ